MTLRPLAVLGIAVLAFGLTAPIALAQHAQYYVLDGFGGVHAAGGAPGVSPGPPYFGFDIARDIEYVAVGRFGAIGDGLLVLDGFGGIHTGGALNSDPPVGNPPYFGFDVAKALTLRNVPPRVNGNLTTSTTVTSSSLTPLTSVVIRAPDDGFLLVIASTNVWCQGVGNMRAEAAIDVDGGGVLRSYFADVPDCNAGLLDVSENIGITKLFSVSSGAHTVRLLARKDGGSVDPRFDSGSLAALFVDLNPLGASLPSVADAAGPAVEGRDGRWR